MPIKRAPTAARPWTSIGVGTGFVVAVVVVVAALAAAGCGKTESCRSGTLFLNINLGAYTNVDELDVDVTVSGPADGGGPHHTVLTLKPGHPTGGVEVDFPGGYPADASVMVTLTLRSMGTEVAQNVSTIATLAPGCAAITVDFAGPDGGDGGSSGVGGAVGTGGHGGSVGGAGGAGTTGTGGSAGTTGVTGGGGGAGTAGATGQGGAAGGGHAGTAGLGGAGGGGHAGAAGGVTGTGGGKAGAGGSACVATGPETGAKCFNGLDDDCDGKIDCADPDCNPTAQCVTADPTAAPIGILAGATSCTTTGYTTPTKIMASPTPLGCTGCGCTTPAVACSTTLTSYDTAGLCEAQSADVQTAGTFSTGDDKNCTAQRAWSITGSGNIYGIVTTKFVANASASCTSTGTPVAPTFGWTSSGTFCATGTVGGGCAAGQVCVPALGSAQACQLFDGAKTSCPGGAQPLPWYTGFTGTASCAPCSCGAATGGNCNNVVLDVGSDFTCSGAGAISSGGTLCSAAGIYLPGVAFSGTPTAPTCAAQNTYTGSLAPSGPKTLCCP